MPVRFAQFVLQHFASGTPGQLLKEIKALGGLDATQLVPAQRPQRLLIASGAGLGLYDGFYLCAPKY
jgi:hypothetical protein